MDKRHICSKPTKGSNNIIVIIIIIHVHLQSVLSCVSLTMQTLKRPGMLRQILLNRFSPPS
jgi:hypothetical protein